MLNVPGHNLHRIHYWDTIGVSYKGYSRAVGHGCVNKRFRIQNCANNVHTGKRHESQCAMNQTSQMST